ncbi:hypothetical protein [Pseudomonas sp. MPG01]
MSSVEHQQIQLNWLHFTKENACEALPCSYCLYVFHHPDDGERPYYIGKAKYFGPNQAGGYKGSARYNAGYQHLLMGLLRAGFSLYIAEIGEDLFTNAEGYEQSLIHHWNPIRIQRIKASRIPVQGAKPWLAEDLANDGLAAT